MLEVFDMDLKKTAILENALSIEETLVLNNISRLNFTLPRDDPKVKFCRSFHFVRNGDTMYRILPSDSEIGWTPTITFECEHVIATLIDELMYGDIVIGNLGVYTDDVLRFILDKQRVRHWKLGVCEFSRQFEYGWSHESLLSALFSVPNRFVEPYIWEFDTRSHPWTVNLRKLDTDQPPSLYIREGKNMLKLKRHSDPTNICTRLYAHGYGEGVNALTFADINGGKPYIDSPAEYIEKYGYKTRLWVDRRYEDKKSLLQAARVMLNELQEPWFEYEVEFVEVDQKVINSAQVGKITKIVAEGIEYKTYILEVERKYTMEGVDCKLTIANKPKDVAESIADLADRQRIEMTYAQGATNLYAQSLQANCDSSHGAVMQFYIPEEMKIVNYVKIKVQVDQFRAYSKSTTTQEQQSQTSSSGGGGSSTSSAGGGSTETSSDGGGSTEDTGASGIDVEYSMSETTTVEGHFHELRTVRSHKHRVTFPDHTHEIEIPKHRHDFDIPEHNHSVTIPAHDHQVTPGIFFFGGARSFSVYVDDSLQGTYNSTGTEVDITKALIDPSSGIIRRGTWHKVEVRPNDLAYVYLDMFVQGFIQSRGDNTV